MKNDWDIKNYMEEAVFWYIDQVIEPMDICKCEKCKYDIAAIALNHLPPRYIVTDKGDLYTKLDTLKQQFEVDIIAEISKAALFVNEHRRHE